MKKMIILLTVLLSLFAAIPAFSAQLKVYVAEMSAAGVPNKDEMKTTLQMLLASRLTGDKIVAVGNSGEADIVVTGTYITIGKIFSVDALAKTTSGKTLTRAFMQGEGQDDLIPAIGKLAEKLTTELVRITSGGVQQSGTPVLFPTAVPAPPSDIVRTTTMQSSHNSDIVRPEEYVKGSTGGWVSRRLPGAANLLAVGATLASGEREIFLAQDNKIQYFRQGQETTLKLMGTAEFRTAEKVISLDVVDADGDGHQEIYVTIVRNDDLASQIWEVKGDKLSRVAADLPYYFRAVAVAGGVKKLYVQEMGRGEEDYYGPVYEATRSGASIKMKNPITMPRYGNIYSFNQFRAKDGAVMTITMNPDNYLLVYDQDMKEVWRSSDKFGGSALYFQRDDAANVRVTGDKFRWIFMNQRIQVTSGNEILVGRNSGFFVIGNARSYTKGAVYDLVWDGSSLEEKWRTKEIQSYMPDYWYDELKKELLILQMPQKPGIGIDGASSLAIKKVE